MKKFLVTLLVAMLALSCVAYAAEYMDDAANHGYDAKTGKLNCVDCVAPAQSKAPTCTEEGYCIHKDGTVQLKKLPHTVKPGASVQTKDPTCGTKGEWTHICAVCGNTFTSEIEEYSHPDEYFFLVKPDCVTVGIAAKGCPICKIYEEDEVYTWWKDGKVGETKKIDGVTYKFYADCAKTTDSNKLADHADVSGWLVISERTCVDASVKQAYCRACQRTLTEYKAPTGHDLDLANEKTMIVNRPSCEVPAIYGNYVACKKCDYYKFVKTNDTSKGEFNYADLQGYQSHNAVREYLLDFATDLRDSTANGSAYLLEERSALYIIYKVGVGYNMGHHVVDPATRKLVGEPAKLYCYNEGNEKYTEETMDSDAVYNTYVYSCAVCKQPCKTEYEFPAAPEHKWTAWKEVVAPTEDTDFIGKWTRYCQNSYCNVIDEYIGGVCGAENHLADAPVLENVVEATYTADGSAEEVVYCAVCGEEMTRTEIVLPMLEGINPDDNTLYEDGKASTATGIVTVDGKDTYLINGVKQVNALGAILVDGEWYWMAHGVVAKVTGAQLYDGEWFYAENGKIDITKNGLIKHDGEQFWVACGRLTTEYTGLVQNGSEWILISAGRFADEYTGVVTYDGAQFNVENGYVK